MNTKQLFLCGAILGSVTAIGPKVGATPGYRLVDIGAAFATNSYALGINNQGDVVGYWHAPSGARAFLRSQGIVIDLGALGTGDHYALSINDSGQVVGFAESDTGAQAFIFQDGAMRALDIFGGLSSYALANNNPGQIVGYAQTPEGDRAFVYTPAVAGYLPTLGGTNSYALAINSVSQIVGSSLDAGNVRKQAFLWQDGVVINLNGLIAPMLGWDLEQARGINDSGFVAGWGSLNGSEQAFLFGNNVVTGLGVLPNTVRSYALALNNSNEVVGASASAQGVLRAFVWRDGILMDLTEVTGASGWVLREARSINDSGEIVGWGVFNGIERAFMLIPEVSQPQTSKDKAPTVTESNSASSMSGPFSIESFGSGPATNSPLADAHVRDGADAGNNFGTVTLMELQASATSGNNRDVYFKFAIDNAPLPLGSAKLKVWASLSGNGSVGPVVYAVSDTNWGESTITWNNKPALGSALVNQTFSVKAGASYEIDVTSYIRSELNAGRYVVSLGLQCTNNTTIFAKINSKENSANKPVLILNTNAFPTVSISSPANNSTFPAPTNLVINATASDSDGTVTNVEFFAGAFFLGSDSTSPYSFTWTNAPIGTYALKARAIDDQGEASTSAVVNLTISTNLTAIADAHVKSDAPTSNFGTATLLEVQTNGASGPTRDTFMRFDISSVSNISSAKIRIFSSLSGSGTGSGTYYSVADTNWGETAVTWNTKPALSNVLGHVSVSGTSGTWRTNDISDFVKEEKAAGSSLVSLALHSQTNSTRFIRINSREASSDKVEIVITTTNSAPSASITSPANGAVLIAPATIPISATAGDSDGSVMQVEFFAGSTSLGVDTSAPYGLTWSNVTSGSYALTVRATDNYGLITTSAVVNVTVDERPTVSLTAPANGVNFPVYPTNITLTATASDSDGTISQVEFFQGSTSLGVDSSSPYSITWSNVTGGAYALTARATDNLGVLATSAVVTITVDFPPSVTITAPADGSSFAVPADISVTATATDSDGTIAQVDFYAGSIWIGADQTSPFSVTWNSAPAGTYALSAKATDNLGVTATSTLVYITNKFSPTNLTGLRLWLDAEVGLETNASRQISRWVDQSGNNNSATQSVVTSRPILTNNVLNGRPVVRFDATDDNFTFQNNPVSAMTQGEIFGVVKAAADAPGSSRSMWTLGPAGTDYPSSLAKVREAFGSGSQRDLGDPAQPLNQFNLYNVAASSPNWSARINGVLQYSATNNTPTFTSSPRLGASSGSFDGDMAEVVIYNRALNANEREAVGRYLATKYALVSAPAAPSNLTARAISSNQVSLAWSGSLGNSGTKYIVERKAGTGAIYEVVASVDQGGSYLDSGLTAGTQYFYRVKAVNYGGESDYSNEVSATPTAGQAGMPTAELVLWLKGDAGHGAGNISAWIDQSTRGNNAVQVQTANRPLVVDSALNTRPVVRFDSTDDNFTFQSNPLTGMTTEGEVFAVLKAAADAPGSSRSMWTLGPVGTDYPSSLGVVREGFGTSSQRDLGDPAPALNQFNLYNVSAISPRWSARFNGVLQSSATNVTISFTASVPRLGLFSGSFDGDMAEVLIYNRGLTADERDAVGRYLVGKYALMSAPAAPSDLTARGISSNQVTLTWSGSLGNNGAKYVVERKTGAGGTYAVIAVVEQSASYLDGGVTIGNEYVYRVKAVNYGGESDYSNEAGATPISGQGSMPTTEMVLWLKGDAGHGAGNISIWADQSGKGNHAVQVTSANRPLVVEDAVNGRSVIRFDVNNDNFTFQNNPVTNMTQGEVFAVVKAAADAPGSARSMWTLGQDITHYPLAAGTVREGFGTITPIDLGDPPQPLNQYQLYNVASSSQNWSARFNGLLQYSTNVTVSFTNNVPRLGSFSSSFDGDMAEVLIYNRVLTADERNSVGTYLNEKYRVVSIPTGPVQLTAQTLSPSQVALSWRQTGSTTSTVYLVERRLGTNGGFQIIGQISADWRYFDAGLTAGTTYSYRVRNTFTADTNLFSSEVMAQTLPSGVLFPLSSVAMWLRAGDINTTNNGPVSSWMDFWTSTLAAVQTNGADMPMWIASGLSNNQPAVRFAGGKFLELPSVLTNASAAEVFAVLAATTNSPATNQGLWKFNTDGATYFPSTNGAVQDAFGSTLARSSIAPLPDLTVPLIYGVAADTNLWRSRFNGPVKQSLLVNTVAFSDTPLLGRSTQGAAEPFSGVVGELIIFNRVLTLDEQKTVRNALAQKFAVTLEMPHVPSNLTLARTNTVDTVLRWTALVGSENGFESLFVVERQASTNSAFLPLTSVARTEVAYLDSSGLPEILYRYRLRVVNDVGEVFSSALSASLADSDGDGVPDYLETLLGTNTNSSDSDGDGLPDGWELKYGLNPLRSDGRDGASGDFDNDGLSNLTEYNQGTNPADGVVGDDPNIRLQVYRPN